ncbi:hypothetical protein D3C85_1378370 [compost metagenome]
MLHHLTNTHLVAAPFGVDEDLDALGQQRRGGHRRGTAGLQRDMRHSADVPQLREDTPAGCMHGIGHASPTRDLFRAMDARRPGVALALLAHLGAFADDQSCRCTLAVILGHQSGRNIPGACAGTGHGRHNDAVGQLQLTESIRGKQHGFSAPVWRSGWHLGGGSSQALGHQGRWLRPWHGCRHRQGAGDRRNRSAD